MRLLCQAVCLKKALPRPHVLFAAAIAACKISTSACFPSGPMAKCSRRLEMRAGRRTMGNQWNNEGTVSSPSVARCHTEEPEGIWFDLGFLKHRCGLTNSFGALITSSCSVSHWSPFLRTVGDGETEALGGDSGDVTPVRGATPGPCPVQQRLLVETARLCMAEGVGTKTPQKYLPLGPNSGHVTALLSSRNCSLLGNFALHTQARLFETARSPSSLWGSLVIKHQEVFALVATSTWHLKGHNSAMGQIQSSEGTGHSISAFVFSWQWL